MYLVEIEAGREQLYQSVEALAAAIRDGVIGRDARIFHRASSSWVSITLHPEYRKAMAQGEQTSAPPLRRNQWTFFNANPAVRETIESAEVSDSLSNAAAHPAADAADQPAPAARGIRALFARGRRAGSSSPEGAKPSES